MKGTIARLNDKGFGFIKAEDGNEYFFYRDSLKNAEFEALQKGDAVTLDQCGQGPKGLRTEEVYLA